MTTTITTEETITSTDALATVRLCKRLSESSWTTAVDTADDEYLAQDAMDACLYCYDDAITALEEMYEGWRRTAIDALRSAKRLESEWGDDSDASTAIEAVQECTDEIA